MNPYDTNPKLAEPLSPELSEFEHQLRNGLRPVDPPAGFVDRVLARARQSEVLDNPPKQGGAESSRPRRFAFPGLRSRLWAGSAIAAMLLAGVVTEENHRIGQRHKAEEAQRQFETALQVTDRTLEHVREQLYRAGVPLEQ